MRFWKLQFLLLAFCGAVSAQGQDTFKCKDANGRTVYVDRACEVYGLQSLGQVPERMTVAPASPDAGEAKGKGGASACAPDAKKFCAGVKQGEGRIVDCLIDHQQDISEDCYQFLKARQSGKK